VIDRRSDLRDAEFILYADINFNIVDGSSVWLSSMLSALAKSGKTLILSKKVISTDIIWSNVQHRDNVILMSPEDFGAAEQTISPEVAIAIIRQLDALLPLIRRVVLRGLKAAYLLCADRQFYRRSCVYLTDFYEIENNEIVVSERQAKQVSTVATQAGFLLTQTEPIADKINDLARLERTHHIFPPPIPDDLPQLSPRDGTNATVTIGYAGKVTPFWGIDELLNWSRELSIEGGHTELHIVANRISDGVGKKGVSGFGDAMKAKIEAQPCIHYPDFNRRAAMNLMAQMDFVWCYRPPQLEDNTLELSTKLVEMIASGAACICYPSAMNRKLLGDDYPYFVRNIWDLKKIISCGNQGLPDGLADRVRDAHGLSNLSQRLQRQVLGNSRADEEARTIVLAGHDFKFIDPYFSQLKANGHRVLRDQWNWGGPADISTSQLLQSKADIILCEWGLANAVWHSENKRPNTKLFIRVHLQEINKRAEKFGHQINGDAVDVFIFVEEGVRRTAIKMFGINETKTHLIPNFLLDDEYKDCSHTKHKSATIKLGMIGITPQRKRFDRAVDLLEALINSGRPATLAIKGPRPEELAFMHGPGRVEELEYYKSVYARIENDPQLGQAVHFSPWGNDVAAWYRDIDFILSTSEFESFHYALADGILSCLLYTSDAADDLTRVDLGGSRICEDLYH